jgi:hypothetical protein
MCSLYAAGVLNIPPSVLAADKNTHETPFVTEYKGVNPGTLVMMQFEGCHYSCTFLNAERLSSDFSHIYTPL